MVVEWLLLLLLLLLLLQLLPWNSFIRNFKKFLWIGTIPVGAANLQKYNVHRSLGSAGITV
jgi:hypothetical protein